MAGLTLDDWQQWILRQALSEQANGDWSAFEVAILVSRQNGKGSILEARQLAGLYLLHERLQVHTAHEFKTCFEHFLRVVQLIESTPDLDRKVMRIRRGAGEQAIELKTGERLRFLARSSGSGRGMSGDVVYLDEAFALTAQMMGALLPTLSARPNPQVWYTSSAPKASSEVLHSLRERGQDGSPRLFFAEWGQVRGIDIEDRDVWYETNPALGIRISEEFIQAELEALRSMPQEFARERLGVPDSPVGAHEWVVPQDAWGQALDPKPPARIIEAHRVVAWDVSPNRSQSSIAFVALRADGMWHQEIIATFQGTEGVAERVASYVRNAGSVIRATAVVKGSPAYALLEDVQALGVEVTVLSSQDYAAGCGSWFDKTVAGTLRRCSSAWLDSAVAGAVWRDVGDTRVWDRRNATTDITPLCAATTALRALETVQPAEDKSGGFVDLSRYLDDLED